MITVEILVPRGPVVVAPTYAVGAVVTHVSAVIKNKVYFGIHKEIHSK